MLSRLFAFCMIASVLLIAHDLIPHEELHTAMAQGGASSWHAPTDHEHGDAPPAWIAAAGYTVGFDEAGGFHGSTSASENTVKHASMKGMLATFKDRAGGTQTVYQRVHLAANVMERSARFHSYETWMQDASAGVSHWQGWSNMGDPDPAAGQRRSKSLNDNGQRPIVLVVDWPALQQGKFCEQWYGFTSMQGWGPDLGWTICNSSTMYYPQENTLRPTDGQPYSPPEQRNDPSLWIATCPYIPNCLGADRELEFTWYGPDSKVSPNRGSPPKGVTFWATQFGEIVSGQSDPKCSASTVRFGTSYPNVCLSQYIAATARSVENRSDVPNANRFRKTYPMAGVRLPN